MHFEFPFNGIFKTIRVPRVTNINFLLTTLIRNQEKRVGEFIKWSPKGKCFDLWTNSLNQFLKEMYRDQFGEFVRESWALKCKQANHGPQWNPRTQLRALNMDFSTLSKMDLTRSLVLSGVQGNVYLICNLTHYFVIVMTFLQLVFIILADNSLFLL